MTCNIWLSACEAFWQPILTKIRGYFVFGLAEINWDWFKIYASVTPHNNFKSLYGVAEC